MDFLALRGFLRLELGFGFTSPQLEGLFRRVCRATGWVRVRGVRCCANQQGARG